MSVVHQNAVLAAIWLVLALCFRLRPSRLTKLVLIVLGIVVLVFTPLWVLIGVALTGEAV